MKKILSIIIAAMLLLSLAACKEKEPVTATPDLPVDEHYMDYQEQAEPMTRAEAEAYLSSEEADVKSPQYRQAVMAVNSTVAYSVIKEVQDTKEITEEIEELFEGVAFRFIEGDTFASSTVKSLLSKQGTYALSEDGYYHFTFYDRTLAQTATNMTDNDYTLNAYTQVLDLLLNDPNVEVRVIH